MKLSVWLKHVWTNFEKKTGDDPFAVKPDEASFAANFFLGSLRAIEKELEEPRARLEARGEALAFTKLAKELAGSLPEQATPSDSSVLGDFTLPNEVDAERFKQQLDDVSRCLDQLIEQKSSLLDLSTQAIGRKQQELDLLLREKECLERLNETLRENATLREGEDRVTGRAIAFDLAAEKLVVTGDTRLVLAPRPREETATP